jgi:hypothetical protein
MEGLAANVNSFEHQQRIDRFTISCDGVENNIFDNLRYKVDEFAGYTSGCDVTGMTLKGGLSLENTISGKGGGQYYNYVKSQYNVPISATINIVKMFLHPYMVENMDIAAVNFYLRINGDLVGTGSSLLDMGSYYVLSFCDLNKSVSNSTVLFVVEQSTKLDATYGYFYLFASSSNDLDGDGDKQCTVSKSPDGYKTTGEYQYNADLSLMFYINSQYINPEPSPYDTDILTLSDYDVEQYNPVYISYFISTFEFPNTIKIYDDGVQVFNQDAGFPYPIPSGDWDGTRTFIPQSDGTFWIILVRDGSEIVNLTLTVTATTSNYALWSYPNPTNYNNHITIGYVYDNPGDNPGLILLGSNANMNSTGDALRWWIIEDATSGNFTLQQTDNWYIYIYYGDGLGNYYRIYDLDIHQTLTTLEQDKLNVLYTTYTLSSTNNYKFTQQISGHHNWYGMTVEIRINNAFIADVGSTVDFILEKEISTDGDFLVQMYLVSNGTDVLLKEISFSVSFVGTPPSPPTQSFRDLLGGFAWVFGFGLIFMFMLLPMTIASKLGIELPMMANIGSAALGLSFTVYAGLLDQWVIFITVIAMVVGAIVVMFR